MEQIKEIKDQEGRSIFIIDNAVTYTEQEKFYNAVVHESYKIGFEDTDAVERLSNKYLHCSWSPENLYNSGFRDILAKTKLWDKVNTLALKRITINLSVPSDTYFPHCHHNQWSLIYYANLDWKTEWGGETLFYDNTLSNIVFASAYIPGRIILFDGEIPHSIKSQNDLAPHYRFSLALFFDK